MKKSLLFTPVLFFVLLLGSCKKDNTATPGNNTNTITFTSVISAGTWDVTSFTEKTENKTSDFSGMDFTFASDGTATVSGAKTASGTWSYSASSTDYYGATSPATFTISIVSGSTFSALSRKWNISANTAASLRLDHPQASEDEHVTFTKK
ncbi:MAG: hypothetical protein ABI707_17895 [Ferruginibacter sp.]